MRKAKEKGKKLGRPKIEVDGEEIQRLRSEGLSLRAIAEEVSASRTTVGDFLKATPKQRT